LIRIRESIAFSKARYFATDFGDRYKSRKRLTKPAKCRFWAVFAWLRHTDSYTVGMQYTSIAPQTLSAVSNSPDNNDLLSIHRSVETLLSGKVLNPDTTTTIERVLCDHAMRHALVFAARDLADLLRRDGLTVTLQYCSCPQHGHPLPFLVAQDHEGNFIVPQIFPTNPILAGSKLLIIDCSKPESHSQQGKHKNVSATALCNRGSSNTPTTFCDTSTVFTRRADNTVQVHTFGAAALVLVPS
jgi:hypothetical protein